MTNTIIQASAGSGKTYQLSNKYLDIVFRDHRVETILATTFTRKAAGEILSRILMRLARASLKEKDRDDLTKHVALPEPIQLVSHTDSSSSRPETDAEMLQRILADMARNLYRLRVSTLDSLFNKIATSFSLEFGLPPGWTVLDETDHFRLIGEAIRNVLADSEWNEARKLMNMLQKGKHERSVMQELGLLAKDLLPIVRESPPEAWDHRNQSELDEKEVLALLDRLGKAPLPKNDKGKENGHFVNGRSAVVSKVLDEKWGELLTEKQGGMVYKVISGDLKYQRKDIEGELLACLEELRDQAFAKVVNNLFGQTRATRKLLDLISGAYDKIQTRERAFRFDDITRRLGGLDFEPILDVLNHRMDSRTSHLLLDEFQDTSMPQWNIIRSFADETVLDDDGSFFCVGDVKQAIYAWRGGEAGIFKNIEETFFQARSIPYDTQPLNVSYRSSQVVIDTVNELFGSLETNAALATDYSDAAREWTSRFGIHDTAEKLKRLPGHCSLEEAPEPPSALDEPDEEIFNDEADEETETEDAPDKNEIFLRYVVDRIRQLHETRPDKEIGVLCRQNEKIGPIMARLKGMGIEASEEGGNPLTDSAAVQLVLSAMILVDHPGDTIARFHLANSRLAEPLGLTDHKDSVQAVTVSTNLRRRLIEEGYGPVVESLSVILAPDCNSREFQRLEKLQELAFRFQEQDHGVRTRRFVETVRKTKIESPTAAKIRVMTMHKSKGLQFDIVVLPDLEKTLYKKIPLIVTDRKSPADPIHLVLRYVPKAIQQLLDEDMQRAFEKRIQREVEESLSLLYVAMTRAVSELVMIVAPEGKTAKRRAEKGEQTYAASFAGILRAGLGDPSQVATTGSGAKILYDYYGGHEAAFRAAVEKAAKSKPETANEAADDQMPLKCKLAKRSEGDRRNLPRISPSGLERPLAPSEKPTSGSDHDADWDRDTALLRGTAMHACFEYGLSQNPWLDRTSPDSDALLTIVEKAVQGKKGTVVPEKIVEEFLEFCRQPVVRKTLSRTAYPENLDVQVEHERRFVVKPDAGHIMRGSVDRLVVLRDAGKVVALDVIDYKTDRPDAGRDLDDFLAERQDVYAPQIAAYRLGMARLFNLDESAVTTKLLFVSVDRVVEL